MDRFGPYPESLAGDTAYATAGMLGWLVYEHGIEPRIAVFDKSKCTDGTFSREDFKYERHKDRYICPGGKILLQYRQAGRLANVKLAKYGLLRDRAVKADCEPCAFKKRCCPKERTRKLLRPP